ncbi:MAG: hypothetical protein H8E44_18540 [Planctomycetes bacterium]|nr:hypothetical protein [Planctomycetota bacterium]MBL7039786.1 hypothetical protein [Pirellulaceae bacterium]
MARHSFRSVLLGVCAALTAAAIAGCGSSGPKTIPVSGKVTIGGKPAKGCRIDFHPIDKSNQVASGQVGNDGSYKLYTGITGTPGAMAGKYKVVLVPDTGGDISYMESGSDADPELPIAKSDVIPKQYTDASTTPKEVEVTSGTKNIDIDIPSSASGAGADTNTNPDDG